MLDRDEVGAAWASRTAPGAALASDGQLVFMNVALEQSVPKTPLPMALGELAAHWALCSPAGDPFIADDVPLARVLRTGERTSVEVVLAPSADDERRVFLWDAWLLGEPSSGATRAPVAASVLVDIGAYDRHRARLGGLLEQARRELVTLSTPVLTLGEGRVLQPLIGSLAGTRGTLALEELLAGIGRARARFAIVDVTGVPEIDRATAKQLIKALAAAALLGCEIVLTGIRPAVARMMTVSGVDLSSVRVARDVASALELAVSPAATHGTKRHP